ncbi:MAG: hypothetical protein IJD80_06895, partial [Oscillospiraceae bacterium]|nr:hypothetical protein [Oscillospiraceae bacterium]
AQHLRGACRFRMSPVCVYSPKASLTMSTESTVECTEKIDIGTAKLLGYQGSTYTLYKDDGISPDPKGSLEISVLKTVDI